MTRDFAFRKRNLICLLALGGICGPAVRPLFSAPQSNALMVVEVRPEAYLAVESMPLWKASGDRQSIAVPLKVMLRMNRGAHAILSISGSDQAGEPGSGLDVETEQGIKTITASPIAIRSYSRSGSYDVPVVIRPLISSGSALHPISLTLRLASSDGTVESSQVLNIPQPVPAAPQPPLFPAP